MKTTVLFNPAISSLNLGDEIIAQSCKMYLKPFLDKTFVIEFSSHLPITKQYMGYIQNETNFFLLGSNLLMSKMNGRFRQWDVSFRNADVLTPTITMGVGWHRYSKEANRYTKRLYQKLLIHDYYNSVRDRYTEEKLKMAGVSNVLYTACPTLWSLTPAHCKNIATSKSKDVVCTLTDYAQKPKIDQKLLRILLLNYETVFLWPQGERDRAYFEQLKLDPRVQVVPSSLEAYDELLRKENFDYVGTRLHGGIRALQQGHRTLIVAIDNRAIELHENCNLPIILRENLDELENKINLDFSTNITIPVDNIAKWLKQFDIDYNSVKVG